MLSGVRYFYQFSALHAFLIGLLPFFLPTILWRQGFTLADIALFISLSGLGYFISLIFWEKLRTSNGNLWAVRGSFIIESLLVAYLVAVEMQLNLFVLALLNGLYGCFYWMSQRFLFKDLSSNKNSGNHFGNFQILVGIMLKVGILSGAFLLEQEGRSILLVLTIALNIAGLAATFKESAVKEMTSALSFKKVSFSSALKLRDSHNSRLVFLVDGLFLFLESYFWTLSLYFLSQENLMKLGGLVIGLTIAMAVLFWLIKNTIDKTNGLTLFKVAAVLYAFSWALRALVSPDYSPLMQLPLILLVAFLTSLFRLFFNKLFFDRSEQTATYRYLLTKSYYSQLGVVLFFGFIAFWLQGSGEPLAALNPVYWCAALLAPCFLLYGRKTENQPVCSAVTNEDTSCNVY
ncbi:hypothetical protein [Endozoicomonas sp. OPT23]|uniref:hypothetical protein n=1 Tax=Endozoicomonas sp. OPT23 TaxID=2072845 RepID=UPI00129AF501|nr:hypothetical protein [Endozoicomonas sp. OPT23]